MAQTTMKIAAATRLLNHFKDDYANGVIEVRTGSKPSTAENASVGTLLGTITLEGAAFAAGVATNGLEFDAAVGNFLSKAVAENWKFIGLVDGVAGWARHFNNAKTEWIDCDVSGSTGTGALKLSNLNITVNSVNTVQEYAVEL